MGVVVGGSCRVDADRVSTVNNAMPSCLWVVLDGMVNDEKLGPGFFPVGIEGAWC